MIEAFTLMKKKETDQLHLFKGDFSQEPCTAKNTSICHKMERSESKGNIFSCKKESEARTLCAEQGRKVCGTCVSDLCETY